MKQVQRFELPATIVGRFDHFGFDLRNGRLFATPEDFKALLVLDLSTGRVLREIHGIAKPHAVLYREDLDRIYVTDGVDGALKIFDGATYQLIGSVSLSKDADAIGYEPSTKELYIVNGGGDEGLEYSLLSVVDTTSGKKTADIRIEGRTLEAMALDVFRPRLYLNNRARNRVTVVDRFKKAVLGEWPITLGKDNVAMALDEAHQRLFVGCRSGHVVVFDTNTGAELQALSIPKGIDDLQYDPASKRLYAAGDGSVAIFEQTDADSYTPLGESPTGPAAKTARLAPQINRYFVAAPQHGSENAAVLVFEPAGVPPIKQATTPTAEPVHAPAAERLVLAILSAHPDLRKMGLHATPPGKTDSVIVANGNTGRIGVRSTEGDLAATKDGKSYCARKEDGSFYNIKLPMFDAESRHFGILVMEIPFTSAADETSALRKAEGIRLELAKQIPDVTRLFEDK
jgi:DNA-binding beta-propeller fold protein YncE